MSSLMLAVQDYDYGDTSSLSGGAIAAIVLVSFAFAIFFIVAGWRVYTKAGQPGWAVLVPFYNIYVQLKIVGRPGWWLILQFIPLVNIVIAIIISLDLAKAFGKGSGFGLGLFFLAFIFFPILAFGSAQYVGPVATQPQG